MNIAFNHNDAPAFEFKDGRYYYTFTAEDDLPSVEILSDCMGDTQLKKIQIERHPDMTYWVPPEVYEGNLSGIFKDLKELLFEMRDTNSDFWGKIQLNARVMLEEYHQGTLSAEFMRHAGGVETRLRNELTGVEQRYTQKAEAMRQQILDSEGNYSLLSQIVQGIQSKVSGRNGIESQIHQLSGLIDQRVTRNEVQSIINQSGDTIWLSVREKVQALTDESKMTGSEIISAINITTGGIYAYSGNNKLVLTPDTTYIQNGTIKSAMIESLDAGKIKTGELNAAVTRTIQLDASQITSGTMSANRINGGVLQSLNGGTQFNLQTGWLEFHQGTTGIRNQFSGRPLQYLVYGAGAINGHAGSYTALMANSGNQIAMDRNSSGIQIWNSAAKHTAVNLYGNHITFMQHAEDHRSIDINTVTKEITNVKRIAAEEIFNVKRIDAASVNGLRIFEGRMGNSEGVFLMYKDHAGIWIGGHGDFAFKNGTGWLGKAGLIN